MRRVWLSLVIFVLTFISVGILNAQNPPQPKGILDYSKELGLSQKQVEAIRNAINSFEAKARENISKQQAIANELNNLLKNENFNMDLVAKKIREIYQLRADLDIANIETARKINSILTPEQRKKWQEIRNREMERMSKQNPHTTKPKK